MSVWYIEKYHWIYEKKIDIQSLYYFFTIPFQTSQKGTAEILQRSFDTCLASRDARQVSLPRGAASPVRQIRDSHGFQLFLPQQM